MIDKHLIETNKLKMRNTNKKRHKRQALFDLTQVINAKSKFYEIQKFRLSPRSNNSSLTKRSKTHSYSAHRITGRRNRIKRCRGGWVSSGEVFLASDDKGSSIIHGKNSDRAQSRASVLSIDVSVGSLQSQLTC